MVTAAVIVVLAGAGDDGAGALWSIKNAEMSRASSSLNWKFGIVAVTAYACGSFNQAKIHSRLVFAAMRVSGGAGLVVCIRPCAGARIEWHWTQPYRASSFRPRFN